VEGLAPTVPVLVIQWEDGVRQRTTAAGVRIRVWRDQVPKVPRAYAYVRRIDPVRGRTPNYRWIVMCPELRFDGYAKTKEEAFGMAERAPDAFPYWFLRIQELREQFGPRSPAPRPVTPTPEEERVFFA
jgi:hypothetical protein